MKKSFKQYKHSLALLLIGLLAFAVFNLGVSLGAAPVSAATTAFTILALWQLSQFAMCKRGGVCFISGLTPEQLKEFGDILAGLKEYADLLPQLKDSPRLLKDLDDRITRLARVQLSSFGGGDAIRPGQLVSDQCAEYLVGLAIVAGQRKGRFDLLDSSKRETLINMGRGFLGDVEFKTALSSSDIPLPVEYSGQVVQLVNQYGNARRYGTVFPSGGVLKLPRLKTDPAFGLLAQSAALTEKSPQTEWVTFTPEKFGGLIRLPSELDEDSIIALGQFIADYAARNIALVEDQVFFMNLDGSTYGAVKGLCGSTITNAKVTQMSAGNTAYSNATLTYVRTLRNVPDAAALRKAAYYMHPSFEQLLTTFNTSGNKPYNPTAQIQGRGANPFQTGPTLDGFEVRWVDILPAYSAGANVSKVFMLFGDLSYQYLAPRGPIRFQTSVDAAFETDEILIRALERFTIGLMANGAVAGLQTAAS